MAMKLTTSFQEICAFQIICLPLITCMNLNWSVISGMCIPLTVWVLVQLCAKELKPLDTRSKCYALKRQNHIKEVQ